MLNWPYFIMFFRSLKKFSYTILGFNYTCDFIKVETIGDAFMLTAGILETTNNGTERIANMALAMNLAIRKFKSPIQNHSLKLKKKTSYHAS